MNGTGNEKPQRSLAERISSDEVRRLVAREELIEGFLVQVEGHMKLNQISRTQLAARLKCSPANVTRILRRTANLTVASMADIAIALGCRVEVRLEPGEKECGANYFEHVAQGSWPGLSEDVKVASR